MIIDFDSISNAINMQKHGVSFERVDEFDFEMASYTLAVKNDCDETHYRALGFLDGTLYILEFVEIIGGIRVTNIRKAKLTDDADSDWSEDDGKNRTGIPKNISLMLGQKQSVKERRQPYKVATIIYIDEGILAAYQARGEDWQTRINDVLKEGLRKS